MLFQSTGLTDEGAEGGRSALAVAAREALAFARRGWLVFPCRPGGKQPATRRGFRECDFLH